MSSQHGRRGRRGDLHFPGRAQGLALSVRSRGAGPASAGSRGAGPGSAGMEKLCTALPPAFCVPALCVCAWTTLWLLDTLLLLILKKMILAEEKKNDVSSRGNPW